MKTTEVFVPGHGIHEIDGHVTYDEAVTAGRAWLEKVIAVYQGLLDRSDEWQVQHRVGGEYSGDVTPVGPESVTS